MTDLPARLARKWCWFRWHGTKNGKNCACVPLATAISEALEEAEKVARYAFPPSGPGVDTGEIWRNTAAAQIADAIAALRKGR